MSKGLNLVNWVCLILIVELTEISIAVQLLLPIPK